MVSRAGAFARRIIARHSGVMARAAPLEKVQRRLPSLRWVNAFHQHWRLGLAANLKLQFAGDSLNLPRPDPVGSAGPPAAELPPAFVRAGTTLERLLLRTVRIDSLRTERATVHIVDSRASPARPAVPAIAAAVPAQLRIERVYRDRAFARAQPGTPAAVATALRTPSQDKPRSAELPAPIAATLAPPLDIQRLADQVVNAIDRRLLAHRERLGRI